MIPVNKCEPKNKKKNTHTSTTSLEPGIVFTWGEGKSVTFPHTDGAALKLQEGYIWFSDVIGKPVFEYSKDSKLNNITILGKLKSLEVS